MIPILRRYEGTYTHIPGVPHRELVHTYGRASVFVLVSVNDGFPNVVIEAMACGVPVIVSENVGVKDIIREGVDGFVVPIRDVGAIQERLTRLKEDPSLRARMGRAASLRARVFTWDRYGERLVEVYRSLLTEPGNL
jgi:glycosyltransferase involved in cell wall biosynthesis